MRHKIAIIWPVLIALLAVGVPWAINALHHAQLARRTEADYRKLVDSNSEKVFSYYPEIFDRISADRHIAERITFVHLSYVEDNGDYSSLEHLTNVEEIQITYSQRADGVIATINKMPSLKRAMFAYCGPTEKWLSKLQNPTLETLKIHDYQTQSISVEALELCQNNMPSCTIKISGDDENSQ